MWVIPLLNVLRDGDSIHQILNTKPHLAILFLVILRDLNVIHRDQICSRFTYLSNHRTKNMCHFICP